ncbi:Uncharacterized protein TCM_043683 [Theobroma cacao]|uniref:Uncharacterized protein n=1 Tax=Theobroma cacao TaxID=3641 RepID=A0A061FNZ0_THECC|nr:Uncharacterized protein TCM_043683 [Theobroma cacao]
MHLRGSLWQFGWGSKVNPFVTKGMFRSLLEYVLQGLYFLSNKNMFPSLLSGNFLFSYLLSLQLSGFN